MSKIKIRSKHAGDKNWINVKPGEAESSTFGSCDLLLIAELPVMGILSGIQAGQSRSGFDNTNSSFCLENIVLNTCVL